MGAKEQANSPLRMYSHQSAGWTLQAQLRRTGSSDSNFHSVFSSHATATWQHIPTKVKEEENAVSATSPAVWQLLRGLYQSNQPFAEITLLSDEAIPSAYYGGSTAAWPDLHPSIRYVRTDIYGCLQGRLKSHPFSCLSARDFPPRQQGQLNSTNTHASLQPTVCFLM